MPIVGIVQSLGLFFVVCLAVASLLSLAMVALAGMERATVPARPARSIPKLGPVNRSTPSMSSADAVSSPGSCTFGPRR